MATIAFDKRYGTRSIRFRFRGRYFQRSLKGLTQRQAEAVRSRVEETIRLIEHGRIEMPPNVEAAKFILSDGRLQAEPVKGKSHSIKELFEVYYRLLPTGAKEESTIKLERIHEKHLVRHLGSRTLLESIRKSDLQSYIASRLRDRHHGKHIQATTVRKEITTLRLIWNWAYDQEWVNGPPPTKGLVYPKSDEKPRFMTYSEIEARVSNLEREEDKSKAWESLFLTTNEIADLLDTVRQYARFPYVYRSQHAGKYRQLLSKLQTGFRRH